MNRKNRIKRSRRNRWSRRYKVLSFIAIMAIIAQAFYPFFDFLPSFKLLKRNVILANDDILSTGETEKVMFQNMNPEFKVEFGNKEQSDKPFVRFQALGSHNNPFAKEKNEQIIEGFLRRLTSAFVGDKEKGIEFGLREGGMDLKSPQSLVLGPESEKAGGEWGKDSSPQSNTNSEEFNGNSETRQLGNSESDRSVLEAQAELEAEQKILDILEGQLDQMIKDADWHPVEAVDIDKKREELKKQILSDLIKAQPAAAPTQAVKVEDPADKNRKKDGVVNKEVVPGVDAEYRIMESKGLKEEIVLKSQEGFSRGCVGAMIKKANETNAKDQNIVIPSEAQRVEESGNKNKLDPSTPLPTAESLRMTNNKNLNSNKNGNPNKNTNSDTNKNANQNSNTNANANANKNTKKTSLLQNIPLLNRLGLSEFGLKKAIGCKEPVSKDNQISSNNDDGFKSPSLNQKQGEGLLKEAQAAENNGGPDGQAAWGPDFSCSLPKNEFTFDLKLDPGVVMKHAIGVTNKAPQGTTYFEDEKGKYLFHFLPLYAYDSTGAKTSAVKLEIKETNDSQLTTDNNEAINSLTRQLDNSETRSYTMKVIVDLNWLLDPARIYPVRIDPSIVHDTEVEFDAGDALNRVRSLSDPKVDTEAPPEMGNGADGACTVSSGTTDLNSSSCAGRATADAVNFSVTGATAAGQNQVTVSTTPTGLAVGDEILVINLMGTSGDYYTVGRYETKTITAISTNTLTLNANLKYAYDGTTQKIMVQRVPNYTDVTVASGATLTATAWNGTKNGMLFFKATGTVTITGTLDMASKGFQGGVNNTSGPEGASGRSAGSGGTGGAGGKGGDDAFVSCTEACSSGDYPCDSNCQCGGGCNPPGTCGSAVYMCGDLATNGSAGTNNAGGGGGGGDTLYCTSKTGGAGGSRGGGGGGGGGDSTGGQSNGSAGGSNEYGGGGGGGGGRPYNSLANNSTLNSTGLVQLGGGAAAGAAGGTGGSAGDNGAGGSGGNPYPASASAPYIGNPGGGIIMVHGSRVFLNGAVSVNGGSGGAGVAGSDGSSNGGGGGGGGGGADGAAGGSIVIKGKTVILGTVTASGGSGGAAGSAGTAGTGGGNGGAGSAGSAGGSGQIGVYYATLVSGSTTPTATVSKIESLGYDYASYTSDVLDLSGVTSIDSLQWTENGVRTGNGETTYSSTGLVAQWNFNDGTVGSEVSTANNDAEGTSCGGTPSNCDGTLSGFTSASKTGLDGSLTEGWTANNARWPRSSPEALMFDGSDDYVSIADNASLKPAQISIEAWIKADSITTNDSIIGKTTTAAWNDGYGMDFYSNAKLHFWVNHYAGSSKTEATIPIGEWVYVVGTYDLSNTKLYINGNLVSSRSYSTAITHSSGTFEIGRLKDDNFNFDGIVDSVRVYSRALTVDEILSNYQAEAGNIEFQTRTGADNSPDDGSWEEWKPVTSETAMAAMDADQANWSWDSAATYMPQAKSDESNVKMEGSGSMKQIIGEPQDVDANVVGLWHMDETGGSGAYIKDTSGNSNNGTPTGTTLVDGISNKARNFASTSDYISVTSSSSLQLGTSQTVEAWIKQSSLPSGWARIVGKGDNDSRNYGLWVATDGDIDYQVYNEGSSVPCDFWDNGGAGSDMNIQADNKWHHIVGTYNGTTGKVYIDGAEAHSSNCSVTPANTSDPLTIGYAVSMLQVFKGSIDEVRVSNNTRSAEEVAEAYRMGRDHRLTKTFPQTFEDCSVIPGQYPDLSCKTKLPFWVAGDRAGNYLETTVGESAYANGETDANTAGLWHLEEQSGSGAYIMDSTTNNLDGTPTSTTFTDGQIGKARLFDDSDDYIEVSDNAALDLSTNGTIEAWIKPNADEADNWFVCKNGNYCLGVNASGALLFTGASSQDDGGTTLLAGKWYHVAVTGNNTTATYYINGLKVSTDSVAWGGTLTNALRIGRDGGSNYFDGLIDEVRISNSVRTEEEIRQVYEVGRRTHPITIDFQAKLDSGNLIANTSDTSFTVDARPYLPTTNYGENLYVGDKVIVKENYDGTEYIAQGTVTAITTSSGATTVAAWDTGSTVPSGGFTANAGVFKWQREWMDVTGPISNQINAVANLTLRCTEGSEGRTVYLDDFKSGGPYLTDPAASSNVSSTVHRYIQYRALFSSVDPAINPYLSGVTVNYTSGPTNVQLMRHGKYFSSGARQAFWWARP